VIPTHESKSIDVNLRDWRVERSPDSAAPVGFAFPPPFDNYAGVFPSLDGRLNWREDAHFVGAHGWFKVSILDVTTGENVASADLKVARYEVRVEDGQVCVNLG